MQGRKKYWNYVCKIRGNNRGGETFNPLAAQARFIALLDDGAYKEDNEASFQWEPDKVVPCLDTPFNEHNVKLALKKIKNSALGEDCVYVNTLRLLKAGKIATYFNSLSNFALPDNWYCSILVLIPKPGSAELRGLSLQTAIRTPLYPLLDAPPC